MNLNERGIFFVKLGIYLWLGLQWVAIFFSLFSLGGSFSLVSSFCSESSWMWSFFLWWTAQKREESVNFATKFFLATRNMRYSSQTKFFKHSDVWKHLLLLYSKSLLLREVHAEFWVIRRKIKLWWFERLRGLRGVIDMTKLPSLKTWGEPEAGPRRILKLSELPMEF